MDDGSIVIRTEIDTSGITDGATQMKALLKGLVQQFSSLSEQIDNAFRSNGTIPVKSLMQGLDGLKNSLLQVQTMITDIGKTGGLSFEDSQYAETELEGFNQELEILLQNIEAYKDAQTYIKESSDKTENVQTVKEENQAQEDLNNTLSRQVELRQANNKGGFNLIGSLKGAIANIKSSISGLFKSRGSNGFLSKMLKPLTSFGGMLKRMIIRRIMMSIINGVREGMQNLAKYSKQVEANLTTLKSALGRLKNSFATAFAPILSIVTPILATLINYLSQAITLIAQFFSALGGSTTFVRAKAYTDSYTNSVGGASKATKELERQLAGFDELEILSANKGGGGGGGGGVDPSDMFETVEIAPNVAQWVQDLKDAFNNGNFDEVGNIIATKINEAIGKAQEIINPEVIQPKIDAFIVKFGTIFNSIVTNVNWEGIGELLANGVNIAFLTLGTILTTVDFPNVASAIATIINGFFSKLNWVEIGKTVGTFFKTMFDSVSAFLKTLNTENLGSGIMTFIDNAIKALGPGTLGRTISVFLRKIFEFGAGLFKDTKKLDSIITGLFDGIVGIIDGLSAQETIDSVGHFFERVFIALPQIFMSLIASLFRVVGALLGAQFPMLKGVFDAKIGEISDSLRGWGAKGSEWLEKQFAENNTTVKNGLNITKEQVIDAENKVAYMTEQLGSKMGIASDIFLGELGNMGTGMQGVYSFMNKLTTEEFEMLDNRFQQGGWEAVYDFIAELKNPEIANAFRRQIEKAKGEAKKVDFKTIGGDIVKGIGKGIDAQTSELLKKAKNLTNKIKADIQKGLKISSPSKVMEDEVGKWIPLGIAEGIEDTTPKALKTMDNLAESIADEIDSQTYSAQILPEAQLTGFADTIVDGFVALGDKLQSIAERIAYTVPSVANGLMPYSVGSTSQSNANLDMQRFLSSALVNATNQIVSAINANGDTNITIDSESLSDTIISNINKRTRQLNTSPLVV